MTPQELLEEVTRLGIVLEAREDRLRVDAPKGVLTPDLKRALAEYKAELLAFLAQRPARHAEIETQHLLAWATQLAEQDLVLPNPVSYVEAPLRSITTEKVSRYASIYLRTVLLARTYRRGGSWHPWTTEWWRQREEDALGALAALLVAMDQRDAGEGNHE